MAAAAVTDAAGAAGAAAVVAGAVEPAAAGILYRRAYHADLCVAAPRVDVLELVADHYLDAGRRERAELQALAERYAIVLHALDTSIGSTGGVDERYLRRIARVVDLVRPRWWSDHLAFTRAGRRHLGAFAPLPRTDEAIEVVAGNVARVRRIVDAPFALENIAAPFAVAGATLTPGAFLGAIVRATGCGLVLDLENLHADAENLGLDAPATLAAVPHDAVWEVHLAGGYRRDGEYVDAHAMRVAPEAWTLYDHWCARGAPPVTIVERETALPPLAELLAELDHARARARRVA